MRFFAALEIPEESRDQLKKVQDKIRSLIPGIRITDNDKLHLTIAFIGEQEDEMRASLSAVIQEAVKDISPFQVTPAYIDGFPILHQAKILWVGVKGDTDKLFILRERVKDGLIRLGLDVDERRYIPHIAIGKVKDFHLRQYQEREFENVMVDNHFEPILINCVKLFESVPNDGLHSHNTLAEIQLQPQPAD